MQPKNQKKNKSKRTTTSEISMTDQICLPANIVIKEKNNAGKTYRAKGPQSSEHGLGFEIQLLMLTSLNMFDMNIKPFYIASGMKQALYFDDVAIFYPDDNSKMFSCVFLQSKHFREPRTIQNEDLKSKKPDDFLLAKYFNSYKEIKEWSNKDLLGSANTRKQRCTIKHVVLCSNGNIDSSLIGLNMITQVKAESIFENIFNGINLEQIKFYRCAKEFLDQIIGRNSEDFYKYLVFAFNFPTIDIINSNISIRLHEIKRRLHNPELCVNNYRGWLFDRLVRVTDPDECRFLEYEEIDEYLNSLLVSDEWLIYNALTYNLTNDSIFQQIIPLHKFDILENFLQHRKKSVICCYSSNEQPVRWATAQIYLFLTKSKMVPSNKVIIVNFDEAIKEKSQKDLTTLALRNHIYIIVETTKLLSYCPVTHFTTMNNNSLSKMIVISSYHKTNLRCIQCPCIEYFNLRKFQKKSIALPFNTEIHLHDFIEPIENTTKRNELLNTSVLKYLLSNQTIELKQLWLSKQSETISFPHISRTLRLRNRTNVQQMLEDPLRMSKNEFFIVVCDSNESNQMQFYNRPNIKLTNNPSQEEIQQIIDTLNNFAYIHLIEINNTAGESIGIWKSTYVKNPSTKSHLRCCINTKLHEPIEDRTFNLLHRITVLVAEPGMGKSYFVKWLMSNKEHCIDNGNSPTKSPKYTWKIFVILRNFEELFMKNIELDSLEHAAEFLFNIFDSTDNDKQLCQHFLLQFLTKLSNDHALVIAFDGFDEINEHAQKNCIKLINLLNTSTAIIRIIVTTRKHTVWHLSESFVVPQYDFEPITKSQQIGYLESCWNGLREKAEEFIERLSESINDITAALLGTPLLCQIIAEAFKPVDNEIHTSDENSTKLNIIEIYEKFIKRKYTIYLRTLSLEKSNPFSKCMFDYFIHVHQRTAFNYLRPDIYLKWFGTEENPLTENFLAIIHGGGIAESTGNYTNPHFIHRTFAEYFEAKLYISILSMSRKEKDPLVRDCKNHLKCAMLCPEYRITKLFLDSYFDTKEFSLFHEQWISIKNCWLFVPIPISNIEDRCKTYWLSWQYNSLFFNARTNEWDEKVDSNYSVVLSDWSKSSSSIDNLRTLISFAEFYNLTNCELALKQIDSQTEYSTRVQLCTSLCHRLFLLPKFDRQHITNEIRKNICKEDSSDETFELRVWLELYDYVDENVNLLDVLEPDQLFLNHAWLFQIVFPRLFSCDHNRQNIVEAFDLASLPCTADLLLHDTKDGDDEIVRKMEQIDQLETEMYRVYSKPLNKIADMDEIDRQNILGCSHLMLLREPLDECKLALVPGFADVQHSILDRNKLIIELNYSLKRRKENQIHFIKSFFGTQDICDVDTYLRWIEEKVVKSVESICDDVNYPSQLHILYGFFQSHFEVYLAHLCDKLCLFTPKMKDHLLYLGEYHKKHHRTLYMYIALLVPKLLKTLDWAFPRKQTYVHIDIETILNFLSDLCEHRIYYDPFLGDWYKGIIKLIQKCVDQLSNSNIIQPYTMKSVCRLLSTFVRKANIALITDIDENKFLLHQTSELKLFMTEIMTNNVEQWHNILTEIQNLPQNDDKQQRYIQTRIQKSPYKNVKNRQNISYSWTMDFGNSIEPDVMIHTVTILSSCGHHFHDIEWVSVMTTDRYSDTQVECESEIDSD